MIIPPDELSIEAYHSSAPAWLSKTTLRLYEEHGPAWFALYIKSLVKPPQPAGVEQGLALDCLLTEDGAGFLEQFAVRPACLDLRTKAGKDWQAEHAGKHILSLEDMAILVEAVEAVQESPAWPRIQGSMAQHTVRRHSPSLGLGLQSRPDWIHLKDGLVFDLKKTRDLDRFGRQAIDLGYHLQAAVAAWCLAGDGIAVERAYLVAVEWQRGARCRVYEIPQPVLEYADGKMRAIAAEIADRLARCDWTDRQDEVGMLEIPDHMMRAMGVE